MNHLHDRVVPFATEDGLELNLINVRGEREPTMGPVILVHGAGVRANVFRAPVETTIVDVLVEKGYDVWLENWRASIDFEPNHWTCRASDRTTTACMSYPATATSTCSWARRPLATCSP